MFGQGSGEAQFPGWWVLGWLQRFHSAGHMNYT